MKPKIDFEKISSGYLKLKKKQRYGIFAALNLIIIGCFVAFSLYPKYESINNLKREVSELEEKVNQAKVKAARLKQFEKEYAEAQEKLKKLSKVLPESSEVPELLKLVNRLGEECGLKFYVFAPENPADKGDYFELPVNIEVRGGFHNVAKFLSKITQTDRLVVTENINIMPQYQPSLSVTARFKASTYWLKEQKSEEKKP